MIPIKRSQDCQDGDIESCRHSEALPWIAEEIVMKTSFRSAAARFVAVVWLGLAPASWSAEPFVVFGLTNTPIGEPGIRFQNGELVVRSSDYGDDGYSGSSTGIPSDDYGVSIHLGEADSGVWVYP